MLTKSRHRIHARHVGIASSRWQQTGNNASAGAHLLPALTRLQLRVLPHALHVVDPGIGDLRLVQAFGHCCQAQAGKCLNNQCTQDLTVVHASDVGIEALIVSQLRLQQHRGAKQLPFPLVLQAKHDGVAITGWERAVRVDGGVRRATACRCRGAGVGVVQREVHPFDQAFEHGHLNMAAFTGFVAQ
ncbi:hypothetical protein D3C78_876710 [compost metagenome]